MSAQNPIPANATPAVMRAWVEDFAGHLPVAENVQIERVNCGPCEGDLILPAGGDASRLIIFYHGRAWEVRRYQHSQGGSGLSENLRSRIGQ